MSQPKSYLALVVCLKSNIYLLILRLTQKKSFVPDAVHITKFKLVNLVLNESGFDFTIISTCILNFINKCIFLSYSLSDLGTHSLVYFFQLIRDARGLWSLGLHLVIESSTTTTKIVLVSCNFPSLGTELGSSPPPMPAQSGLLDFELLPKPPSLPHQLHRPFIAT